MERKANEGSEKQWIKEKVLMRREKKKEVNMQSLTHTIGQYSKGGKKLFYKALIGLSHTQQIYMLTRIRISSFNSVGATCVFALCTSMPAKKHA